MKRQTRIQWKTSSGSILDIEELTDLHLQNALKFSERRNNHRDVEVLSNEIQRRKNKRIEELINTKKCVFCKSSLVLVESEKIEIGISFPKYSLGCSCCGSTGPKFQNKLDAINKYAV